MTDDFIYYPDYEDPKFIEKITRKKEFFIYNMQKETVDLTDPVEIDKHAIEICRGDAMSQSTLQHHQAFSRNFFNPETPFKNGLVFKGTGTGKTRLGIAIGEEFKKYFMIMRDITGNSNFGRIFILSSKDARENFFTELYLPEFGYMNHSEYKQYLEMRELVKSEKERQQLKAFVKPFQNKIKEYYKFLFYEKFKRDYKKIEHRNMDNTLIIIDEAHNIERNEYGDTIMHIRKQFKDVHIILMTATPMYHYAHEIVPVLNLILPLDKQLKYEDIFVKKDVLKDGFETKLYEAVRGYILYFRGQNPFTFPRLIQAGSLIKPYFKHMKLIRCKMSQFQYKTYMKYNLNDKLNDNMQKIVDMVLPNPESKEYGLFLETYHDVEKIKTADLSWRTKNEITIIEKLYGSERVEVPTGPFLEMPTLGLYSAKYSTFIQNLIDSCKRDHGKVFIYHNLVARFGVHYIDEILRFNGFENILNPSQNQSKLICCHCGILQKNHVKSKLKKQHEFASAKFILIHGNISPIDRDALRRRFNSISNLDASKIKIIVGSPAMKEASNLIGVREVHIMDLRKVSGPSLDQIVGRALRHCSHIDYPYKDRTVEVYKYVTSFPDDVIVKHKGSTDLSHLSLEERRYHKIENMHVDIKKIERALKIAAFDCALNKGNNVIALPEYEGTSICDYMACDYKCLYDIPKKPLKIDVSTYGKLYYEFEMKEIKYNIFRLYKLGPIFTLDQIIEYIKSQLGSYINPKYVYLVIDKMIDNPQEKIYNKFDDEGYLIYRGNYYIFHPINEPLFISLEERVMPSCSEKRLTLSFNAYLNFLDSKQDIVKFDKDKLIKIFEDIPFDDEPNIFKVVSDLDIELQQSILENVIEDIYDNHASNPIDFNEKIILYYKKIGMLVTIRDLEISNYDTTQYSKTPPTSINVSTKEIADMKESLQKSIKEQIKESQKTQQDVLTNYFDSIVGHVLSPFPSCYSPEKRIWSNCIKQPRKKDFRLYEENTIIIGFMDKHKNKIVFKLRPPIKALRTTAKKVPLDVIDRRSLKRGFICVSTSHKEQLTTICDKLDIKIDDKDTIPMLCHRVQTELIRREEFERIKGSRLKWYYTYLEMLNI